MAKSTAVVDTLVPRNSIGIVVEIGKTELEKWNRFSLALRFSS